MALGYPVKTNAGRTLAAIPKSVIQTSPGLTAGIVVLHSVKNHRSFQSRLIAQSDVRALVGDFQEHFPNGPPVSFGQVWELFDDISCCHRNRLNHLLGVVRRKFLMFMVHDTYRPPGRGTSSPPARR